MLATLSYSQRRGDGMSSTATQTVMTWSIRGDLACVEFFRGEDHYVFAATPSTLRESLRLVGECAADKSQCLTWVDAEQITRSLRQIVLAMPAPVAPSLSASLVEVNAADSGRVMWFALLLSAAFWCGVFCLIERVMK